LLPLFKKKFLSTTFFAFCRSLLFFREIIF
jgi:hypothetical protein